VPARDVAPPGLSTRDPVRGRNHRSRDGASPQGGHRRPEGDGPVPPGSAPVQGHDLAKLLPAPRTITQNASIVFRAETYGAFAVGGREPVAAAAATRIAASDRP
jgi:hypothetical protein